ncbi:MAG TPA: OmpA family protein [Rhodanobacteraceae bacterium]|nr:OmpA family protein [Rhodanobacteraceae bacterium]
MQKGDDTTSVTVAGAYCNQDYTLKDGAPSMSYLEAQYNYRDQLQKLGATILYKSAGSTGGQTVARLTQGGKETWIDVTGGESEVQVWVVVKQPLKTTLTAPTGSDYRLLGHMPNYEMSDKPQKRNFDQASFTVQTGDDTQDITALGAAYQTNYTLKDGAPAASYLEVQDNYVAALKKLGAQIVYHDVGSTGGQTDARLLENGRTIWIKVDGGRDSYSLSVIEEKPFVATIKPAQASELKAALDKDGHVALYINFDFDKATLRPDAAPVIAQVLALLKANPDLKLSIVGNTDNVGGHDYNIKLSQARAAAVMATLVKDGIAAGRLQSSGDGPDKPIASNDDSEGRARNRRVELVKD